jgi:hypothetical protein
MGPHGIIVVPLFKRQARLHPRFEQGLVQKLEGGLADTRIPARLRRLRPHLVLLEHTGRAVNSRSRLLHKNPDKVCAFLIDVTRYAAVA